MRTLSGRVAVVTGAGSGIGRAVAVALARAGCRLALVDVDADGLEGAVAQVEALGRPVTPHVVDVSDRAAMAQLPADVLAAHGAVHVLVNNAGVSVDGLFEEQTLDDWEWLLGVNLWGVVHGCHFFLPALRAVDEAHIVNISSVYGLAGVPFQSSYCASKYAVRGLTEVLWEELAGSSIGVTVVHPAGVATNIVRAGRAYDEELKARTAEMFEKHAMPPDAVAERIVDAIRRDRKRLLVARGAGLIDLLRRIAPVRGNRLITRISGRLAGKERRKRREHRRAPPLDATPA